MNDRLKFRVWNKNTHSFTTGGAIKFGGLCFVDKEDFGIKLAEDQECYIIEQCTGLKDKNGNLIYEGDIVEISVYGGIINEGFVETDTQYQGIVVWVKQGLYVKVADEFFYIPEEPEDVEIIGNIHETKE